MQKKSQKEDRVYARPGITVPTEQAPDKGKTGWAAVISCKLQK